MPDPTASTSNIWPYYASQNVSRAAKTDETLGKDQFLRILVAQLRHQDPMQPMQDRDFIAQMAQFSAVEQTMNMAKELEAMRQSIGITPSLIGKSISWLDYATDGTDVTEHSGIVNAITFKDGKQYAVVEQQEIALEDIIKIWQADSAS